MAPVLGRQTKLFNILYFTEYIMKSLVWRPRTGAPEEYKNYQKFQKIQGNSRKFQENFYFFKYSL